MPLAIMRCALCRTCLHPDAVCEDGGCLEEGCRLGASCRGNRLEWLPGSNKTRLQLSFPHHKNEARYVCCEKCVHKQRVQEKCQGSLVCFMGKRAW